MTNIFDSMFEAMNASGKAMIDEGVNPGRREVLAELKYSTQFCETPEQYKRAISRLLRGAGGDGND